MKKLIIKIGICLVILGGIVASVLMSVRSGDTLVSHEDYIIRPDHNKAFRLDVYGAVQDAGTQIQLTRDTDGANQTYRIEYLDSEHYAIFYTADMCVAVASDKQTVVVQGYDITNDYNLWKITNVDDSNRYTFTNVATGKTLCYQYIAEKSAYMLIVKPYDAAEQSFRFVLDQQ